MFRMVDTARMANFSEVNYFLKNALNDCEYCFQDIAVV